MLLCTKEANILFERKINMRRMLTNNDINGAVTPEGLLNKIEGSDYISVDMNEAGDKVVIELDLTDVPTTAGTYVLKCTVNSQGEATFSWVKE